MRTEQLLKMWMRSNNCIAKEGKKRMRIRIGWQAGLVLLGLVALSGCSAGKSMDLISADENYEKTGSSSGDYTVEDKDSLYKDESSEVITMYLTIGMGNENDGTNHTWEEMNGYPLSYYEEKGIDAYKCEAVLQVGDEAGPIKGEFGYEDRNPNVTVQLRGSGASEQQQKSYRIEIKSGSGNWKDQKVISLNKHQADPVRFKNKLAYSLMQQIPDMLSCRTTFVHLYVKDKSEGENGLFRDYGLYTQVEQINGTYLKNRGLDNDGQLYQVGNFDWERHEDSIRLSTDVEFNQDAFEQYLEIKGDDDHQKLIDMLTAVNDESRDIEEIVDTYFEKGNLFNWMAFHMLLGNKNVMDGNYYIYSPRGVDRWYFISWDNDSVLEEGYESLRDTSYSRSWNEGFFPYLQGVLFRRIFQNETLRNEFDQVVRQLCEGVLSEDNLQEQIEEYGEVTEEYLYQLPDISYARVTQENYEMLVGKMAAEVEENFRAYQESLNGPWPFHILTPYVQDGKMVLSWEPSYSYQGKELTYTVEMASDFTFQNCIVNTSTPDTTIMVDSLPAGQYFIRVRSSDGVTDQDAYEYYQTEAGPKVYSTLCFYVHTDGSIDPVVYGEDG